MPCRLHAVIWFASLLAAGGCAGPTRTSVDIACQTYDGEQVTTCLLGEESHRTEAIDLGHNGTMVSTRRWLSVYTRRLHDPTARKIEQIALDKDGRYKVVRCDERSLIYLEYHPGGADRRLRRDFIHKATEVLRVGHGMEDATALSRDGGIVITCSDHFEILDADARTSSSFDRREVGRLWSCDRDGQRILLAARLESPIRDRIIEFNDGRQASISPCGIAIPPFTAFYTLGSASHLALDASTPRPMVGLYDAKNILRAQQPLPSGWKNASPTFSVTTGGDACHICVTPLILGDREEDLLDHYVALTASGWNLVIDR